MTDRKMEMIISGGESIASTEVERVIYETSCVREAAVIGIRDTLPRNPSGKLLRRMLRAEPGVPR